MRASMRESPNSNSFLILSDKVSTSEISKTAEKDFRSRSTKKKKKTKEKRENGSILAVESPSKSSIFEDIMSSSDDTFEIHGRGKVESDVFKAIDQVTKNGNPNLKEVKNCFAGEENSLQREFVSLDDQINSRKNMNARPVLSQFPSFDEINRYGGGQNAGNALSTSTPIVSSVNNDEASFDFARSIKIDSSLFRHLSREICGSHLVENEQSQNLKREKVYNTMFHVPWRCELLIVTGLFVCLDSFLSLFTITPLRLLLSAYRFLTERRRPFRMSQEEICDMFRVSVLFLGVIILLQADVSLIYHWIRGQAIIKLYVIYNVLEIFDKLCQSFGSDLFQVVNSMAAEAAASETDQTRAKFARLMLDAIVALPCFFLHSLVIMCQSIALNVAINSHSNALFTLLVSNNFSEVKSNVFKRFNQENIHKMAYLDIVERFHIISSLVFVFAQNLLKGEASFVGFLKTAATILAYEMVVDLLKHAFVAKFNEITPAAYSHFLKCLCKQTLETRNQSIHQTMNFVPLAPACVVVRGVCPLFLSLLPQGSPWLRLAAGGLVLAGSMLLCLFLKAVTGVGLQLHARWYLVRSQKQKLS